MIVNTATGNRSLSELAQRITVDVALVVLAETLWKVVKRNKLLVTDLVILACVACLVLAAVKYTVRFLRWAMHKTREAWCNRRSRRDMQLAPPHLSHG